MVRGFVAIVPPVSVVTEAFAAFDRSPLGDLLGDRLTRSKPDRAHLTLRFFADVDLDRLVMSLAALRAPPLRLRLGAVGVFPSTRRARVAWVGIVDGEGELADLVQQIDEIADPIVGGRDQRFVAHLTRGRITPPANVARPLRDPEPGSSAAGSALGSGTIFEVTDVVVFESRPDGRRFTHVERARIVLVDDRPGT